MIRSAGLKYDIRKVEPYSIYGSLDFDVPTYETGDLYDRYLQRIAEARESVKIMRQCLDRIPVQGSIQARSVASSFCCMKIPRHAEQGAHWRALTT